MWQVLLDLFEDLMTYAKAGSLMVSQTWVNMKYVAVSDLFRAHVNGIIVTRVEDAEQKVLIVKYYSIT